jgi:hypothetical protein
MPAAHAHIVTGAHYNGDLASPAQRVRSPTKSDRPRGVRGFRSLGLRAPELGNTVKARRCDDIIHACNKRLHKELR